jgi:hypothetical protein
MKPFILRYAARASDSMAAEGRPAHVAPPRRGATDGDRPRLKAGDTRITEVRSETTDDE